MKVRIKDSKGNVFHVFKNHLEDAQKIEEYLDRKNFEVIGDPEIVIHVCKKEET